MIKSAVNELMTVCLKLFNTVLMSWHYNSNIIVQWHNKPTFKSGAKVFPQTFVEYMYFQLSWKTIPFSSQPKTS